MSGKKALPTWCAGLDRIAEPDSADGRSSRLVSSRGKCGLWLLSCGHCCTDELFGVVSPDAAARDT